MSTSKYSEEQIIGFLRQAEAGMPIKEMCRKHGFIEKVTHLSKAIA